MSKLSFVRILKRLQKKNLEIGPFKVYLNRELLFQHGYPADPLFTIHANETGLNAVSSLDETRIAEAYINSDIEVEGDLMEVYKLREVLVDNHWLFYLWNVYGRSLLFGQAKSDKKWIAEHYNHGDDFYLNFLDKFRAYSHGIFESDDEDLDSAIYRKLSFAYDVCNLNPGDSVLDIGGGWGTFTEFAGNRGVKVTSLTISRDSQDFINRLISRLNLPCEVINCHFLKFQAKRKFDAIVNLGVTEHLPNYKKTIAKYVELLKPGGKIYLDASAADIKYHFSTFINKYIYPGNPSPLYLPEYVKELAKSPLELKALYQDRRNYYLTAKRWCQNLEKNFHRIQPQYPQLYRLFKLYLYGTAAAFYSGTMSAYRLVLSLPEPFRSQEAQAAKASEAMEV